jgi:hypothetical protein
LLITPAFWRRPSPTLNDREWRPGIVHGAPQGLSAIKKATDASINAAEAVYS